jgi:trehalose 6-phosphate phosphatase
VFDTDVKLEMEQFFGELSRARESALLLDYDGTLSPFQLDREEAFPYPGVSILLTEIMNTGHTRVVLITGRPAPEVVPLLGIRPHPEIFGAHGLQHLRSGGPCELPHPNEIETQALAKADTWLDGLGLHHLAEHKPGGLAVHWRGLPTDVQSDIRRSVSRGWLPIARRAGMVMQEFDGGVEIRLPERNKGDAVRTILGELYPEAPVACEFLCARSGGKPEPMYGSSLRLDCWCFSAIGWKHASTRNNRRSAGSTVWITQSRERN